MFELFLLFSPFFLFFCAASFDVDSGCMSGHARRNKGVMEAGQAVDGRRRALQSMGDQNSRWRARNLQTLHGV